MNTWSSEGIVLKRRNSGEADRNLTIFTRQRGKVRVLAKGIRRIKSRRAAAVELLNYSKFFLSESKGFYSLNEAEVIKSFPALKENLAMISYSYRLSEVVDRFFSEEEEARKAFDLLIEILEALDSCPNPIQAKFLTHAFEVKILDKAGFRPQLSTCSKCSQPLSERTHRLAPDLGGVVDVSCGSGEILSRPISAEAIKVFRFFQDESWERINKLTLPLSLAKEIDQHLSFYLEYLLETGLSSSRFINKVEAL